MNYLSYLAALQRMVARVQAAQEGSDMADVGSAKTHQRRRQRLRRELEARGVPRGEIERQVAALGRRQAALRSGQTVDPPKRRRPQLSPAAEAHRSRLEAETYARFDLDDRSYRPRNPDPLRSGAGRVSGIAARAVGRRTAMTQWQYNELVAKGGS